MPHSRQLAKRPPAPGSRIGRRPEGACSERLGQSNGGRRTDGSGRRMVGSQGEGKRNSPRKPGESCPLLVPNGCAQTDRLKQDQGEPAVVNSASRTTGQGRLGR